MSSAVETAPIESPSRSIQISAVITTYNSGALLEEALESVLAQTRQPDEILVIDDGSTDDTAERIKRFGDRIRYHWQENGGTSQVRNLASRMVRFPWIAFLDADDLWLPERLEVQEAWLRDHPDCEAVFGQMRNFAHPGMESQYDVRMHHLDQWLPGWCPSTMLIRRETLVRSGGFDEGMRNAEMVEWFIRIREAGVNLQMIDVPLARRRLHGANKGLQSKGQKTDLRLLRDFIARKRAAAKV